MSTWCECGGCEAKCRIPNITEQMATSDARNWRANVVIASSHAGLRPGFKRLEDEIYRALARMDDPRDVRDYLNRMIHASEQWMLARASDWLEK
jgi:hypothetical protein